MRRLGVAILVCVAACGGESGGADAADPTVTLVEGESGPWGVAVDGGYLYWTNNTGPGDVARVPTAGGPRELVAVDQAAPARITVRDSVAYWTNADDGTVMSAGIDGTALTELASGQQRPARIAVDATAVYWTDEGAGTVMRRLLSGGAAVPLASGLDGPAGIAIDESHVYWTDFQAGALGRVPLAGGVVEIVVEGETLPQDLAVAAGSAYWAAGDGTIKALDLGDLSVVTLASEQSLPRGLAVDETHVYWTNFVGGEVMTVAMSGGEATVIAGGECSPFGIAVDTEHVYWANNCGTVRAAPKPLR